MGVFTFNDRRDESESAAYLGTKSERFLQRCHSLTGGLFAKNSRSTGQPEPVVSNLGTSVRKDIKMPEVDMNWVKQQLTENKTKRVVGDTVIKLLNTWSEVKNTDPDPDKDQANLSQVIELFSKIALGHAIVKENKNENWTPAQSGQLVIADEVRVKWNAFDGEKGKIHNGRRGKIVSIRYGDIIMKTTDGKEPVLEGFHYTPQQLEKRVP